MGGGGFDSTPRRYRNRMRIFGGDDGSCDRCEILRRRSSFYGQVRGIVTIWRNCDSTVGVSIICPLGKWEMLLYFELQV